MNLVAFPAKTMDLSILRQIIQGGVDKLKEAEVVLIGGHSIEDKEIKYGLSVTGVIHPKQVLAKKNLRPGDGLVLTIDGYAQPRCSTKIMADFDISACTDVAGFGLLGHLAEMVNGSGCSVRIFSGQVPVIPEAEDFAAMGLIPAGAYKNRDFRKQMITFAETVPRTLQDLLFDPQTSGRCGLSIYNQKYPARIFRMN